MTTQTVEAGKVLLTAFENMRDAVQNFPDEELDYYWNSCDWDEIYRWLQIVRAHVEKNT